MATNSSPRSTSIWYKIINLEPALWKGLIVAVVATLLSVGIKVSPDFSDNLIGLVVAVAAIYQALWTRESVVPEAKVVAYVDGNEILRAGPAVPTKRPNIDEMEQAVFTPGRVD